MVGIFAEWIAVIVLMAILAISLYRLWIRWTWSGKRFNQDAVKTSIEQGAEIRCALHGKFPASQLIKADDDHFVCPECYKLYVEIPTFTINDIHNHEKPNP